MYAVFVSGRIIRLFLIIVCDCACFSLHFVFFVCFSDLTLFLYLSSLLVVQALYRSFVCGCMNTPGFVATLLFLCFSLLCCCLLNCEGSCESDVFSSTRKLMTFFPTPGLSFTQTHTHLHTSIYMYTHNYIYAEEKTQAEEIFVLSCGVSSTPNPEKI